MRVHDRVTDLDRVAALRIALAVRMLPGVSVGSFIDIVQQKIRGAITLESLKTLTVADIKVGIHEQNSTAKIDMDVLKEAVRVLWGETDAHEIPVLESKLPLEVKSIKVAVASNVQEQMDGHFGSCVRFLVYQMSTDEVRLIDIRSMIEADLAEDRNAYRAQMIADCAVLLVRSIGAPAAAKVVRAGIHPVKLETNGSARAELKRLQKNLQVSPPPWLAQLMGVSVQRYASFVGEVD